VDAAAAAQVDAEQAPQAAGDLAVREPALLVEFDDGGLALAGAGRLVELAAAALVLGLQDANPSLKGLAVGTPDRFHVGIIHSSATRSCAYGMQERFSLSLGR
jgi:hypothetical protein